MTVTGHHLAAARPGRPLLLLGPSLGTSAHRLWGPVAARLHDAFEIVGWDLPGHGGNRAPVDGDLDVADLSAGVLRLADELGADTFYYAGDSVGGAVGLQLLLDAPDRVRAAALFCTGASIGSAQTWRERIDQVRAAGTPSLVTASAERWFVPDFLHREPGLGSELLHDLREVDDAGYAAVCGALARFDVRDRLGEVTAPVLAVAGSADAVTPAAGLREIADGVRDGRFLELEGVGHLAPAEAPEEVARLLRDHFAPSVAGRDDLTVAQVRDRGMAVRREVLGDAHVDRATAGVTGLTAEFQQLITEYAWGSIWTRPGLDRRSRSMITLTALVARSHHEELALHVRAAVRNGLSVGEIKEVLLQSAIYCGVPDANTAFRIAQRVLSELDAE